MKNKTYRKFIIKKLFGDDFNFRKRSLVVSGVFLGAGVNCMLKILESIDNHDINAVYWLVLALFFFGTSFAITKEDNVTFSN